MHLRLDLTGPAQSGKTHNAGRLIDFLNDEGWTIGKHEEKNGRVILKATKQNFQMPGRALLPQRQLTAEEAAARIRKQFGKALDVAAY